MLFKVNIEPDKFFFNGRATLDLSEHQVDCVTMVEFEMYFNNLYIQDYYYNKESSELSIVLKTLR